MTRLLFNCEEYYSMVDRQGSKVVEEVTEIKCINESNTSNLQCKVTSNKTAFPTTYRNIEAVDIENKESNEHGNYEFKEPIDCEIIYGSKLNRIKCENGGS